MPHLDIDGHILLKMRTKSIPTHDIYTFILIYLAAISKQFIPIFITQPANIIQSAPT